MVIYATVECMEILVKLQTLLRDLWIHYLDPKYLVIVLLNLYNNGTREHTCVHRIVIKQYKNVTTLFKLPIFEVKIHEA